MANVNTGEQVLTAEARQEQAVMYKATPPDERASETVDVNGRPSSSSAQTTQARLQDNQDQQASENFPAYDSPFESYPLLRSHLRRMLSDDESPTTLQDQHQQDAQHSSSTSLSSSLPSFMSSSSLPSLSSSSSVASRSFLPDLKPLKKAASFKALDPSKQICQYELPGDGICLDKGCQDVHLSRGLDGANVDNVEPSDEDTAEYLYDVLSSTNDYSPWLTQERRVIVGAIQDALQGFRGIGKVYEERVAEALATFQLSPPAM